MAKIKVIWFDDTESYVMGNRMFTQFVDKAREYKSVLIAARSARKIKSNDELIKDVKIITDTEIYNVW